MELSLAIPEAINPSGVVMRVRGTTDEPLFCLKDVCDVLGMCNSRVVLYRLGDEDRVSVRIANGNRGNPNVTFITESGLYKTIMLSRKPAAKRFTRWVTGDVLPSIRRHGCYPPPGSVVAAPEVVEAPPPTLPPAQDTGLTFYDHLLSTVEAAKRSAVLALDAKNTAVEAREIAEESRASVAAVVASWLPSAPGGAMGGEEGPATVTV
jgi:prophage antirepressor-like protein